MNINTMGFATVIGILSTIAATVLTYIFIMPKKREAKLSNLFKFIKDIFDFKFLIIEKILQFLYILSTLACVCVGLCMTMGIYVYTSSYYGTHTEWYGFYGILLALIGPIAVRLVFEGMMLFLLLVKNVIQINKKLKSQTEDDNEYKMPKFKDLVSKETDAE